MVVQWHCSTAWSGPGQIPQKSARAGEGVVGGNVVSETVGVSGRIARRW